MPFRTLRIAGALCAGMLCLQFPLHPAHAQQPKAGLAPPPRAQPAPAPAPGPKSVAYAVSGLEKPAEILVDRWGVPHIYANTHYDAFFVQGAIGF